MELKFFPINVFITPGLYFKFIYFALSKDAFCHTIISCCIFPGGFQTLDEYFNY